MLLKTVTLSSRNPTFHQIFVSTRKMHFWRLCRKFWAKYGKVHNEIPKLMRKFEIVGKNPKIELQKKTQSCQQWTSKVVPGQKNFPSKSQNHMKNKVLSRSCFSSKWSFKQVQCSSDKLAELFHQKSDTFFRKAQMLWKKVTHFRGNPMFHQLFTCTRKVPFWQLRLKISAKYGNNSYWNPEHDEKF